LRFDSLVFRTGSTSSDPLSCLSLSRFLPLSFVLIDMSDCDASSDEEVDSDSVDSLFEYFFFVDFAFAFAFLNSGSTDDDDDEDVADRFRLCLVFGFALRKLSLPSSSDES